MVVTADELKIADEDATEVTDDIGMELEIDDTGGWFGLLHLNRKPTSKRNP